MDGMGSKEMTLGTYACVIPDEDAIHIALEP